MYFSAEPFFRHVERCNQAKTQGYRIPFFYPQHREAFGWVDPLLAPDLKAEGIHYENNAFHANPFQDEQLKNLGIFLAQHNRYKPHHELFDVYSDISLPPIGKVDRGALPLLGLIGMGVHMNGLVQKQGKTYLWVGKRSANKRLDPAKLDHIVAGGIATGYNAFTTLIKEADEEASIPQNLSKTAQYARKISYTLDRAEGLRRDILFCYDLYLPEEFIPKPKDGEVEHFSLLPLEEVAEIVRDTEQFKFNVNLVLIDLFLRHGLIDKNKADAKRLDQALNAQPNAANALVLQ